MQMIVRDYSTLKLTTRATAAAGESSLAKRPSVVDNEYCPTFGATTRDLSGALSLAAEKEDHFPLALS